jgi:uncharacterized membrane protein
MTTASPRPRGRRAVVVVFALMGAAVSAILAGFQLGLIDQVWDPLFGSGSTASVLDSPVSEALPVPDALLGLGAYLVEAVLEVAVLARGSHRAQLALGVLVTGMALTALMLIGLQALVVGSWCSLCLASAALSLTVAGLAAEDVRHVVELLRSRLGGMFGHDAGGVGRGR